MFDQAYTYARVLFLFASVPVSGKLVSLTNSWYVVCMYMYLCVTLNECMCSYIIILCVCINKIFETSVYLNCRLACRLLCDWFASPIPH